MPDPQVVDVDKRAQHLVCEVVQQYSARHGVGSMSCSIYDTAWVSMVAKTVNEQRQWCFPSSFSYLLHKQQPDGSWTSADTSDIDGILNTMAALLALCKHERSPYQLDDEPAHALRLRTSRAVSFLQEKLKAWDLTATKNIGFDILVPALMEQLEQYSVSFDFPQKELLLRMNHEKLSKFNLSSMYGSKDVAALHYLEAFVGKLDFDKISYHDANGSIAVSPSSTAAFLMHTSMWHNDSESYLQHAIDFGGGRGSGAVPCAYPSALFELNSTVTTLLESGFTQGDLGCNQLNAVIEILADGFLTQKGLLGVAPAVCPNADESAKAVITLNLLGRKTFPDSLIKEYEADNFFRTFASEEGSSFITNCNVLHALLRSPENPNIYAEQIEKAASYLCRSWWESAGLFQDKSRLSPRYSMMLMSRVFILTLDLWEQGALPSLSKAFLQEKMLVTLFQSLIRTLQTQNENGSWGQAPAREETAYALLTIVVLAKLPLTTALRHQIDFALKHGRDFLCQEKGIDSTPECLWVAKLTYGSDFLSESLILGALKSSLASRRTELKLKGLYDVPLSKIAKYTEFYQQLPIFAETPRWCIESSLIEGHLFLPQLRNDDLGVFPRHGMRDEKYVEFIPFTWTAMNNLNNSFIPANIIYEMMAISVLIYQLDEYMEAVIGTQFRTRFNEVRDVVFSIFQRLEVKDLDRERELQRDNWEIKTMRPGEIQNVRQTLTKFVLYTLRHPRMQNVSDYDKRFLRTSAKAFLLGHITQVEDNYRLFQNKDQSHGGARHSSPRSSFFNWVRTIGTDHVSCSYGFASFLCLLEKGGDCFRSVEAKYVAQDFCQHLGTMCRMYNDYGSARRDRQEKNLNCLDFPEFQAGDLCENEESQKQKLFRLASYERKCMDLSLTELGKVCERTLYQSIRMFCNVTDMYGQMYVIRDLTPHTKVDHTS